MALIRIVVLDMIEILAGIFQPGGQPQKRLREGTKRTKLPIFLSERPVEFHDIKKARWKLPSGFPMVLSPYRVTSSPAYSLSFHHFLPSLI
jgi:hypothetical protein